MLKFIIYYPVDLDTIIVHNPLHASVTLINFLLIYHY